VKSALPRYELFIDGRHQPAASGKNYETTDPFAGKPWAIVPDGDEVDVDRAVRAARAALGGPWGSMTGFDRARLLRALATILERDAEELARLETRDTGKLLREMGTQTKYLPQWFHYFAGAADKIQGVTIPSDRPNFFIYTRQEPVGVVAAIVPWNSPLLLLTWKLAPALAAGCTVVVKPSDYTPVTALELAKRIAEAGFPPGVFNVVTGNGPAVGRALARHPGVNKVAFTGSTRTGIDVAQGAAEHVGRVSLELGGKSAQLVFADADLEASVVRARVSKDIDAAEEPSDVADEDAARLVVVPTRAVNRDLCLERLCAQVLGPGPDVGDPAEAILEPAVGVADHRRVEAGTGHDSEPLAVEAAQVEAAPLAA
jgi:aldehyde dehydrogenase (NAD+)